MPQTVSQAGLSRVWGWFALLVLAASSAYFLDFQGRDLTRHILSWRSDRGIAFNDNAAVGLEKPVAADTAYAVWMVSRNAYTLVNHPGRLFDAEHCAPARRTMTLGEPVITMGILAIPFYLANGDPIVTYNLTQWALWTLTGWAVFLLVASWTAVPAAGLAAGLMYVFHPAWAADISHPTIADMTWTVFALYFAERWLACGRWRDAFGLALSIVLQFAASFYPLIAAVFFGAPVAVWLLAREGLRRVSALQVVFVALLVTAGVAIVYGPYLATRDEAETLRRSVQMYATWSSFLPGGANFPGWLILGLAGVALVAGKRRTIPAIGGDPRWSLLVGALLVALATTGGSGAVAQDPSTGWTFPPNIYALASSVLPGLDSVRNIMKLEIGLHLALCILAGFGVAALLRLVSERWRSAISFLIVACIAVATIQPIELGFPRRFRWGPVPMRPSRDVILFFAALERRGNRGPVLEVPMGWEFTGSNITRLLASAWHRRRTSHCYASYIPPELRRTLDLSKELHDPRTILTLGRLGFTTIVVHERLDGPLRTMLEHTTRWQPHLLRLLFATHTLAAYELGAAFLPKDAAAEN